MKYAINHVKVKCNMIDLYTRLCGDSLPLPTDRKELTEEFIAKAFKTLKNFQIENKLNCKHEINPHIEFLL